VTCSYTDDQERVQITYQKLAKRRQRAGSFLELWILLLCMLGALILGVFAFPVVR
jgi:hypothetical protein